MTLRSPRNRACLPKSMLPLCRRLNCPAASTFRGKCRKIKRYTARSTGCCDAVTCPVFNMNTLTPFHQLVVLLHTNFGCNLGIPESRMQCVAFDISISNTHTHRLVLGLRRRGLNTATQIRCFWDSACQ